MPVRDPKEVFLVLLSNVRQGAERGTKIYQEISQLAQNPDIKEALDARAFSLLRMSRASVVRPAVMGGIGRRPIRSGTI